MFPVAKFFRVALVSLLLIPVNAWGHRCCCEVDGVSCTTLHIKALPPCCQARLAEREKPNPAKTATELERVCDCQDVTASPLAVSTDIHLVVDDLESASVLWEEHLLALPRDQVGFVAKSLHRPPTHNRRQAWLEVWIK